MLIALGLVIVYFLFFFPLSAGGNDTAYKVVSQCSKMAYLCSYDELAGYFYGTLIFAIVLMVIGILKR